MTLLCVWLRIADWLSSTSEAKMNTRTNTKWTVVATGPQVGGGVRQVLVPARHAAEVREELRRDPARIDGLWCAVRVRDLPGARL